MPESNTRRRWRFLLMGILAAATLSSCGYRIEAAENCAELADEYWDARAELWSGDRIGADPHEKQWNRIARRVEVRARELGCSDLYSVPKYTCGFWGETEC
jgi:hypothetical protein